MSKIIPDRASRDDRRGIGALQSPFRSLVSAVCVLFIGDGADIIAVVDPV